MPVLSVKFTTEQETIDALRSLAELRGWSVGQVVGAIIDEEWETGLIHVEIEGEIEALTGAEVPINAERGPGVPLPQLQS